MRCKHTLLNLLVTQNTKNIPMAGTHTDYDSDDEWEEMRPAAYRWDRLESYVSCNQSIWAPGDIDVPDMPLTAEGWQGTAEGLREMRPGTKAIFVCLRGGAGLPSWEHALVLADAMASNNDDIELNFQMDRGRSWKPKQLGHILRLMEVLAQWATRVTVRFHNGITGEPPIAAQWRELDGPGPKEIDIYATVSALPHLTKALVIKPDTVERLVLRAMGNALADPSKPMLPTGMTNLQKLTMPANMTNDLPRLQHPLTELKLNRTYTSPHGGPPSFPTPIIPIRYVNQTTAIRGYAFQLEEQIERRVRCIQYTDNIDIPADNGWRARLLELDSPSAVEVHCDAVVLKIRDYRALPTLRGAPNILVVRVGISDPAQAQAALQQSWHALPSATAFQAMCALRPDAPDQDQPRGSTLVTAFVSSRFPNRLDRLNDLAIALGIASGDNGKSMKSAIARMIDAFKRHKAQYLYEAQRDVMVRLIMAVSGTVTMKSDTDTE